MQMSPLKKTSFGQSYLHDLVLVVVVHRVIPAISKSVIRSVRICYAPAEKLSRLAHRILQKGLVAISPLEVLGSDVLVRVLGALLQGRHVLPVLPVIVPQNPCVDASGNQSDRNTAISLH